MSYSGSNGFSLPSGSVAHGQAVDFIIIVSVTHWRVLGRETSQWNPDLWDLLKSVPQSGMGVKGLDVGPVISEWESELGMEGPLG